MTLPQSPIVAYHSTRRPGWTSFTWLYRRSWGRLVLATSVSMLQALVLPQLSVECLVAIGSAIATCTSPGLGGAVTCGVALIHVLNTCPW